jgi:alpha-L-fucosidase
VVHHDGFLLWDSKVNRWNSGNMGPKRDLYGDLVTELRKKENMKILATFHHIRTFDWYLPNNQEAQEEGIKAGWDLFSKKYSDLYWNHYTGNFEDFIAEWKLKVKEVINNYQPDLLWFDGGKFQDDGAECHVLEILSYYLNCGEEWGKQVEVLNKLPGTMNFNFPIEFGLLTFEEGRDRPPYVYKPWIDDQKISTQSWGYIDGQTYKSANEIMDGFIDRVARGGGLLLSLCPLPDGTLNQPQKDILLAMGKWLDKNGEAIFATRPWILQAEGDESVLQTSGKHNGWKFVDCDASQIRFTRAKDSSALFAIALAYPEGGKLQIYSLNNLTKIGEKGIDRIIYLGTGQEVTWSRDNLALYIDLPADTDHEDLAYAFKIISKGRICN